MNDDTEEFCWSCAKCGKDGPYSSSEKYPKGWRFSLTHGLVCGTHAKELGIKVSDVERLPPNIPASKSWEGL